LDDSFDEWLFVAAHFDDDISINDDLWTRTKLTYPLTLCKATLTKCTQPKGQLFVDWINDNIMLLLKSSMLTSFALVSNLGAMVRQEVGNLGGKYPIVMKSSESIFAMVGRFWGSLWNRERLHEQPGLLLIGQRLRR